MAKSETKHINFGTIAWIIGTAVAVMVLLALFQCDAPRDTGADYDESRDAPEHF